MPKTKLADIPDLAGAGYVDTINLYISLDTLLGKKVNSTNDKGGGNSEQDTS